MTTGSDGTARPDTAVSTNPTVDLPTTPEAIEAAVLARRAHLAGTLDELVERVKPANLARGVKDDVVGRARGAVTDEQGNLLMERVVAVSLAVVALVVSVVVVRRRSTR